MTALAQAIEAIVSRATSDDLPPNEIVAAVLEAIEAKGCAIVPKRPTIPMCLAGEEAIKTVPRTGVVPIVTEQSQECWAAMVKAAPEAMP